MGSIVSNRRLFSFLKVGFAMVLCNVFGFIVARVGRHFGSMFGQYTSCSMRYTIFGELVTRYGYYYVRAVWGSKNYINGDTIGAGDGWFFRGAARSTGEWVRGRFSRGSLSYGCKGASRKRLCRFARVGAVLVFPRMLV